jgi:hypothetical protein
VIKHTASTTISFFFGRQMADAQSMMISFNGATNNERMETQYDDQMQLSQMNDDEVDCTARITFTTPQNVLKNNTIVINDVKYTLNL